MRRFVFAALLALSLPFTANHAAADPTALPADAATATINRAQAFYDQTQTYKATFQQEFNVKAYNTKKTSNGTVVFSKPGKMGWTYANPAGNRVVSNGTTLRVYEAANKQMFEQPVNTSQYPAALSFLLGRGKLSDAFNFEAFEGGSMNFQGGTVLVGTPKTPTPAYTKVLFYVDNGTAQIRRVLILDAQGNRNSFVFSNVVVNTHIGPTEFDFAPPTGTTIVRP